MNTKEPEERGRAFHEGGQEQKQEAQIEVQKTKVKNEDQENCFYIFP